MELQDLCDKVNLGPEFTFRRKNWNYTMEDIEKGRENTVEARALLNDFAKNCGESMQLCLPGIGVEKVFVEFGAGISKYGDAVKGKKISLNIGKDTVFWLNVDLDPNCLEIQAMPMPYVFYLNNESKLHPLIFGSAGKCELEADSTEEGGGGHINLDARQALGETNPAMVLRNLVVIYTIFAKQYRCGSFSKACEYLLDMQKGLRQKKNIEDEQVSGEGVKQLSSLFEYRDDLNAPQICDIKNGINQFVHIIETLDKELEKGYENWADRFNKEFYAKLDTSMKQHASGLGVPTVALPQYQAINLCSLLDREPEKRRIEFRGFGAQDGIIRFTEDAYNLLVLLYFARVTGEQGFKIKTRL